MYLVRLKDKGQLTLPAKVRALLGAKNGDMFSIELKDEMVLLRKKVFVDEIPAATQPSPSQQDRPSAVEPQRHDPDQQPEDGSESLEKQGVDTHRTDAQQQQSDLLEETPAQPAGLAANSERSQQDTSQDEKESPLDAYSFGYKGRSD